MYILGTNLERGRKAAEEQGPNVIFHQCNVSKYQDLAVTFHEVHTKHGRVDYVFANAGATESCDILGNRQQGPAGEGIPVVPDLTVVDVNFNGVLYTSHLAMHYFRLSPGAGKGASLVITGSCGSLYPFKVTPMYAATKRACFVSPYCLICYCSQIHQSDGVLGFMRSIAGSCWEEGIRVNALCPGIVRTGLVSDEFWTMFNQRHFCPMELVVKVTLLLMDGGEIVDSNGIRVSDSESYGQTLETSGSNFYLRQQPAWCDEVAKDVMTKS